jgi:molybdate transport system substrate-binding protein
MPWLAALLICIAPAVAGGQELTVSAAISLKEALTEVVAGLEQRVGLNFASSGQLVAQIRGGAPVDVFIAAADEEVEALEAEGRLVAGSRRVIAGNELVLIVPAATADPPKALNDLAEERFRRVAVGDPQTVPAGRYAMQALLRLEMDEALADRLVYGSNVRQVLDYVARGEVDAGFVYRTDAIRAGQRVKVAVAVKGSLHDPIRYTASIVTASPRPEAARRLIEQLVSDEAVTTFARHGFVPADGVAPAASQPGH